MQGAGVQGHYRVSERPKSVRVSQIIPFNYAFTEIRQQSSPNTLNVVANKNQYFRLNQFKKNC